MKEVGFYTFFTTFAVEYSQQMANKISLSLLSLFTLLLTAVAANGKFTLVIDPGHGGRDAGALGSFSKEKDINLAVSLAFGRYVERNMPDVKVIYTRKTDVFIPLIERANIANRNKADLFVSIHTNALPQGKQAYGFETYTLGMHRAGENFDVAKRENSVILVEKDYKQSYQGFNPNSSESYIMFEFIQDLNMANSVDMAKMIQREVCSIANRPNKGVHQAGFLVLRETSMPGCLVELGFITTAEEERLLNSPEKVDKIAQGLYNALAKYKNKYGGNIVVPYKASTPHSKVKDIVPEEYKDEPKPAEKPRQAVPKNDIRPLAALPKAEEKKAEDTLPVKSAEEVSVAEPSTEPVLSNGASVSLPIFKIQLFTTPKNMKPSKAAFKGLTDVDTYTEGNMAKYTYGASANYREMLKLRKTIADKFPDAFIIAFKDGKRMDVQQAIKEFRVGEAANAGGKK